MTSHLVLLICRFFSLFWSFYSLQPVNFPGIRALPFTPTYVRTSDGGSACFRMLLPLVSQMVRSVWKHAEPPTEPRRNTKRKNVRLFNGHLKIEIFKHLYVNKSCSSSDVLPNSFRKI